MIGYAQLDILANPLGFGQWNKRKIKGIESKKLLESFHSEGCNRFTPKNFIPIIIDPTYVEEGSYSKDPTLKQDLPIFKLSSDTPKGFIIPSASGQHRADALGKWLAIQRSDLKKATSEANMILKMPEEEAQSNGLLDEYNDNLKPRLDLLKAVVGLGGQWGVRIYDSSKF